MGNRDMAELEKSEQEILLENGSIRKNVWNYGIPCALITLINTFYNIVDQIFIGNGVGYLGNGATNVIFPLTTIALACGLLAGSGCAANFSILLGAGERKKAAKCMGNAISLLFTEGILFAVISLLLLPKIVIWFGATDKVYPYAMGYGRIICFGFSFYMISIGLSHILRVDGRPQIATMSTVIGCVINCILDPLFIFKFKWGVEGAAFATIIGQFASLIFSTIAILRTKTVCLSKKDFILDFCLCRKIICGGVTEFCLNICVTILFVVNNNLLVKYGAKSIYGAEIPLATYGIMMKLGHILSALTTGMSQGAQPLIGYCFGIGDYQLVKKAILCTLAQ